MKIKYSALVSDMRNKLNGSVASKNRYGSYLRNKVTPVNPSSSPQQIICSNFSANSKDWRALTDAERLAWNGAVDMWKRTDIFGDLKTPSGFNLFMRINNNLRLVGAAPLTLPLSPYSIPPFTTWNLSFDPIPKKIELNFAPAIPASTSVIVFFTAPQSAGKSFVKSEYRKIAVLTSIDVSPYDITDAYTERFGDQLAGPEKIWLTSTIIANLNGQESKPQHIDAVAKESDFVHS